LNVDEAKTAREKTLIATGLAWLVPGAGHICLRQWKKGALFFVCLVSLYVFGVVLGTQQPVDPDRSWNYSGEPPPISIVSPRNHYIVFAIQVLAGLPTLAATAVNRAAFVDSATIVTDLGQLITMVVGALNMLLIVDVFCVSQGDGSRTHP
jgi:hypothetical protein